MKYRWLLVFMFIVSCSKGYHYKYWILPYYEDHKIETRERKNFEIIDGEYAKDDRIVYYKETRLPEVDPESFRILGKGYSSDRKAVYYVTTNLNIRTNSPKAWLIVIPLDLKIWTEKEIVFFVLEKAKPESFQVLSREGSNTDYGIDGKRLYYTGINIDEDAESPLFLDSIFYEVLKTKTAIYYQGKRIPGADTETFTLLGQYAKDGKGCYFLNSSDVLSFSCSPKSFEVLKYPNPLDVNLSMDSEYAKDSQNVYWQGKVISRADSKTFQMVLETSECAESGVCAKDRNRKYKGGERL
ncbi:DKNYY domain-containing protein [Leptospira sp. 201903070]|uniref:DKNYY domain-containing protein n=1 Tax=Leptospira ainlahdjerensis TaxID=2810033 RepID=A0ABS2UHI0_9LEPT|nr:DKNYY domain-containing protein [Leptospira ainlahdjerensis]MBM9578330.1 DKNYY domain-containing protein [Leptospira ainlahdjerensis]